tara:strand:- start:319 stop:561 length:243 start_codon:yes stop_codon:yes gene_type:complete
MEKMNTVQNQAVFQILDVAYELLQDGEDAMQIIRMCMFIAILQSYELNIEPIKIVRLFKNMQSKFSQNMPRKHHYQFGHE